MSGEREAVGEMSEMRSEGGTWSWRFLLERRERRDCGNLKALNVGCVCG